MRLGIGGFDADKELVVSRLAEVKVAVFQHAVVSARQASYYAVSFYRGGGRVAHMDMPFVKPG